MLAKMKSVAFWIGILGAAKLIAQMVGVEIPDEVVNNVANGIAAVVTVVGIWRDHGVKQS